MDLKNEREVQVTRQKLQLLQQHYDAALRSGEPSSYARDLSLRSLKRMINQMTEEIVRFESRAKQPHPNGSAPACDSPSPIMVDAKH